MPGAAVVDGLAVRLVTQQTGRGHRFRRVDAVHAGGEAADHADRRPGGRCVDGRVAQANVCSMVVLERDAQDVPWRLTLRRPPCGPARRALSTINPITAATASTSAAVDVHPREKRTDRALSLGPYCRRIAGVSRLPDRV